ncbi:MAG: choice-of-anchor Q domain-containing protein [Solirubrobacteraceae bacterium]
MTVRSFHRARARRLDRAARRANLLARRGRLLAGATLGASALLVSNAQAAAYTVTTTADSNDGACTPALCSLRDAIVAANGDGTTDTITFAPTVTGEIDLGSPLDITTGAGLTITGPGADTLKVSGQGTTGIFRITSGAGPGAQYSNEISGLTLTKGSTSDPGGAVSDQSYEPLKLDHDVISDSTSTNSAPPGGGGGVFAQGPAQIVASTITGNTAAHGGGVEINPKYNSPAVPKYGMPLIIQDSTISGNHATGTSGAIPGNFGGGGGVAAYGSELVVSNSTLSGNTSTLSGGAIEDLSKYGLTLSGSKLTGNTAVYSGGAIMAEGTPVGKKYDPTRISNSTISGNTAHDGAGLAVAQYKYTSGPSAPTTAPGQPVTIQDSLIAGNHGTHHAPHPERALSFGGGIEIFGAIGSPFRLIDSTVTGNSADRGGGIGLGGAYPQVPLLVTNPNNGQTGSVSLENSTIAGNRASLDTGGGGIYLGQYKTSSSSPEQAGTAALESTIVAGNKAGGKGNDLRRGQKATTGGFTGDFSLIQRPGVAPLTGNHLILHKNPGLGKLQNNGGPTLTKRPNGKSPVIDQGHADLGAPKDQRGNPRTIETAIPNPAGGDGTDIGAVELSRGQVVPPPDPRFSVLLGARRLGGASTPLLVDGATPVTCQVQVGLLGGCAIAVTMKGVVVASGGVPANPPRQHLTTTINSSTATQRYLLKHFPLGVPATANAVGIASGPASAVGPVRLLGGPSITLPLGTGSTQFSDQVKTRLDKAAAELAGTKTVGLISSSQAQADAVSRRLTAHGVTAPITIRVRKHAPANQITINFTY